MATVLLDLGAIVLLPFLDASYTTKNSQKRLENRVFGPLRHDKIQL